MSPDSPSPSRQRKAWRFIACAAAILAAFSLFASVWLFTQQQSSREEAIRRSCLEQNARHDKSVKALDMLLARRSAGASKKVVRKLEQSRMSTLYLIDALAPRRNCEARVDQLVTSSTP